MKMIVAVALALVAVAYAAPVVPEEPVSLVRSSDVRQPDGSFQSSFEASNGISQQVSGELKQVSGEDGKPVTILIIRGSYSVPGPDGKPDVIEFLADESGYHANGNSIPKLPEA